MKEIKFRDLLPQEIDLRVGATTESGFSLLLYKDARVDMNILDETIGQFNWVKDFYQVKNTLMCKVGINIYYDNENKEPLFIYKADAGDESNTEAIKGEASDSFKRACFNWGIGRKLYTSPFVWIKKDENNDPKKSHYLVKEIGYDDKAITRLVIVNEKTKQVVYSYGSTDKVARTPLTSENKGISQDTTPLEQDIALIKEYFKGDETRLSNYLMRAYKVGDLEALTSEQAHHIAETIRKK